MAKNELNPDVMSHFSGDPAHKIAFYSNHFISKPGMEGFINGPIKDNFPELHQAIKGAQELHSKIIESLQTPSPKHPGDLNPTDDLAGQNPKNSLQLNGMANNQTFTDKPIPGYPIKPKSTSETPAQWVPHMPLPNG